MNKKVIALLIAASMLLSSAATVFAQPQTDTDESVPTVVSAVPENSGVGINYPIPDTFETVAENADYILYANKTNGEIAVTVKANGYNWFSNPQDRDNDTIAGGEIKKRLESQVVIYYTNGSSMSVASSATGCVNRKGLSSSKIDNGIKFTYNFKAAGFTIPVQYVLTDNGLEAKVLLEEIDPLVVVKEQGTGDNKYEVEFYLSKIDFLPFFGAAGVNESGYLFIPEGSGALINFNNGKVNYTSYSAPIYGQYKDLNTMTNLTNDLVRMPVYGLKRGDNAYLAIIEENESTGHINAAVSGRETSFNNVYSTIQYRARETTPDGWYAPLSEPISKEGSYSILFKFLTADRADYANMAQSYRDYLVKEKGLEKSEAASKNELYLETYAGVEKNTSVFGIVRKILKPLSDYSDVQNMAQRYIDAGINNLVIKYNGWTKNSQRQAIKTKASFERKLGGKSKFVKLAEFAEQNGVAFYPAMNFVEYSDSKNGYSPIFNASKTPDQSPAYQKSLMRSEGMFGRRWSLLKPNEVQEASGKFINSYLKLNVGGIALDNIGEIVYSDNTKDGVKRGQTTKLWSDILKDYKDNVGSVMVDNANAYAFVYADRIIDAPLNEYGTELADETVPFYQMVLHGYVSYSSTPINLAGDWKKTVLKAVETGSNLNFTLMSKNTDSLRDSYLNNLYSCDLEDWFEKTVEEYNKVAAAADETVGKEMVGHSKIAEGVYETVYEGNVKTIVNYNSEPAQTVYGTVNGLDFILVK